MPKLLLFSLILASNYALACPQITGDWDCKPSTFGGYNSNEDPHINRISETSRGIFRIQTEYSDKNNNEDLTYIADNNVRDMAGYNQKYQFKCDGDTYLLREFLIPPEEADKPFEPSQSKMVIDCVFSIDSKKQFNEICNGEMHVREDQTYKIQFSNICTRK